MATGLFYYRHYIGDYDTATKDLSLVEHGAYRRLRDGYYANKGPIPAAVDKLYRITGAFTEAEQAAVRKVAGMFFDLREGFLHDESADAEIARVVNESSRQRAAARSRWDDTAKVAAEAAAALADAAARAAAHPVVDATALPAAPAEGDSAALPVEPAEVPPPAEPPAPPAAQAKAMPVSSQDSKKKKQEPPYPPLPEWVPVDAWREFIAMRFRIRKPLTDNGKGKAIQALIRLREQGHDPAAVLAQSTDNEWRGLFPVMDGRGKHKRSAIEAANNKSSENWING